MLQDRLPVAVLSGFQGAGRTTLLNPGLTNRAGRRGAATAEIPGIGLWWPAVPKEPWPENHETRCRMQAAWGPDICGRRQEIAFIGAADTMRASEVIRMMQNRRVGDPSDPVVEPEASAAPPDPFPAWRRAPGGCGVRRP